MEFARLRIIRREWRPQRGWLMSGKPVDLGVSRLHPEAAQEEPTMNAPTVPAEPPPAPPADPVNLSPSDLEALRGKIIDALHTCFDPEVPVNIYELGLIYDLILKPDGHVNVLMTLTTPACPVAGSLPGEVERKIRAIPNVTAVKVDLVWDPPWDKDRMSEAAKLQLGMDDW
jgi:FeS assembly SUF system protein